MNYTKIDQNYFLITLPISKKPVAQVVTKPTNHIFIVDVSGSMSYQLQFLRNQLKNKLSNVMNEGDTITIIWFSGNSQAGILKEEVEVRSLKTLTDLQAAVDQWLRPVGLTAFLKPLQLAKEAIGRIRKNRPNSVFSMVFLTDGYNNDCPWPEVIKTLKAMDGDLAASTFVEYGYYADSKRLTEMAAAVGGEKISCDGFEEFEPAFNKRLSAGLYGGSKISVTVDSDLYDFAYSVSNSGSIILYSVENNKIMVDENVKEVYFFSSKPIGTESPASDAALYAGTYVLSDKLMNEDAEKMFYVIGDNYHYRMLVEAFGKQKLNAFKSAVNECVADASKRFPEGKTTINPVPDDAYCLMDLINDLGDMDDLFFYPGHEEFNYNRIGRKRVALTNGEISDEDRQRLAEAKSAEAVNAIANELAAKAVKVEFVADDKMQGHRMNNLVWNEKRANLSVLCQTKGKVKLSDNKYGITEVPSYKYNSYTLIKDGILNITKLPVSYTKELYDILLSKGVRAEIQEDKYIVLDLSSLPIVNRGMVKSCSANDLAKAEWELLKIQGKKKVFDYYRKNLFPKESKSFVETYGQEQADWLKELGITDYNGFNPKSAQVEATDFYMSVNLETKIKGLSSLPKVEDVLAKMDKGTPLKTSEWLLAGAITDYRNTLSSPEYLAQNDEGRTKLLQNYITSMSDAANKARRMALKSIAQIKFSLILSKKWFNEFKTFEENTLNLRLDGQDLFFTFDLSEKEEKI